MAPPRAFLIDGTAFCYRAFHAIRHLSTSDGRPTNAVYGFVMMLEALKKKERPDYLAVAFDAGKPTFRHRQFEAYKIQRKPMPESLIAQLPVIKRVLAAYRIPAFEQEGYEGEDLLATIATRTTHRGIETFLVTGDKDALQLVNSHIKVYNPHVKDGAILDAEAIRTRFGVGPERVVDLMALIGDDIDNIPGVPGIGEKTASLLLKRFGSLEALYSRLDEVEQPRCRHSLAASRDQVERSRALAQIRSDVPMEIRLQDLKLQEPDWPALRKLFRDLEFKRLLSFLDDEARPAASAGALPRTHLALGAQELKTLVSQLARPCPTGIAVLGWPSPPADGHGLAVLAFARPDEEAAWVAAVEPDTWGTTAGARLAEWLADGTAPKITHDGKTLKRLLGRSGLALNGIVGDTMLAAYLVNPARPSPALHDLVEEYLEDTLGPLPGIGAAHPRSLAGAEILGPFGRAAALVHRLHARLVPALESQGLNALYAELELPLTGVLATMEATGIAVDLAHLKGLSASMQAKLASLRAEIFTLAGSEFNLNSPKQLAQVLFEQLKLPVIKRGKTGPSTDSDVLQQLAAHHPLPERLIHYRELAKLVSTYVEALPQLADPKTGRLHTSFNQTATATGRLSSSDPNLQNIPIKTELGRSIRKAFVPGIPDGALLSADYSQIELRILAHLSGDERLIEAFRQERDIHRFTASLIYGLPESEIQPEQRNAMKAINYGILYGMTSHGLSKELGVPFEESQAFIQAYFERYPKVRGWLDAQIGRAKRNGFVQTLLGRRRYIPELASPDPVIRQLGERMAVNAPIQGTAADLIKRAMVQLAERLERERLTSRMVLQVHDELVFEVPREELRPLAALVRQVMEGAMALTVPLTVTVKAGPNWLDLAELT
jgi:DNA polymerase-1